MSAPGTRDLARRTLAFATLRREMLAARRKSPWKQVGRETSPTVIRLYKMKLPLIDRPRGRGNCQAEPAGPTIYSA
jgi:hypothetical protein